MKERKGKIALMGSGELTPSMVEVHKELLKKESIAGSALFLDTPAGFQPNADDISRKAQEYFQQRIKQNLQIASLKSVDDISDYDMQILLQQFDKADYLLVGPGSPTYMVRQLQGSAVIRSITGIVERGGSLAIASAAALTAGNNTLPVYELYKVGMDLYWEKGLDLLGSLGLQVTVIPHWNNAEGGTHDTRFCYMGEARFSKLKEKLPAETLYLGVDEHTACVIDFAGKTCTVKGQGNVTLQQKGKQLVVEKGDSFDLELLRSGFSGGKEISQEESNALSTPAVDESKGDYWQMVHIMEQNFHRSLEMHDHKETINVLLAFDDYLQKASSNFESEEDISQAREIYREMVVLLGVKLEEAHERSGILPVLIKYLLTLRADFKSREMWDEADTLRNILNDSGLVIEDGTAGSVWKFKKT